MVDETRRLVGRPKPCRTLLRTISQHVLSYHKLRSATPLVNTLASVTTSYGSLGNVPPVEIAHVHQFGSFYLRTYFY